MMDQALNVKECVYRIRCKQQVYLRQLNPTLFSSMVGSSSGTVRSSAAAFDSRLSPTLPRCLDEREPLRDRDLDRLCDRLRRSGG